MRLIIEDEEGRKTIVPFSRDEISIGRLEGNTIRLTERNVSRRHARLVRQTDAIVIEDLGSYNGVRVNGERVDRSAIHAGDVIEIGDYDLAIDGVPAPPAEPDTNPNGRANGSATLPPKTREETTAITRQEDITNPNAPAPGRPLSPEQTPRLVGMAGSVAGREFKLPKTNTIVGRDAKACDVQLENDSVGKQHARFVLDDGTWTVLSLQHDHPVIVNGIPSDSSPIASGDTLEIGALKFRFTAPFGEATFPGVPTPIAPMRKAPAPSRTPMIVGVIVTVAIVAALAFFVAPKFTQPPVDNKPPELCQKAQSAVTAQDWNEAVSDLSLARQLNLNCSFDIEKQLGAARQNLDAQNALQNAGKLRDEGKYLEAIKLLEKVPPDSPNAGKAHTLAIEIKAQGAQKLSEDARKAIDSGNLADAASRIDELRTLDSAATTLPLLTHDLDERKHKAEAAMAGSGSSRSSQAAVAPQPKAAPPEPEPVKVAASAAPAPERTIDERNQMADAEINDGVHLIMTGDFQGGMERLQSALAEAPDKSRVARIQKNMGVAYAQKKQPADAVPHLKIYLKLQADAPDRAKFETYIKQFEARGGK